MSPISKDGRPPENVFWIVRPSLQHTNAPPALFWTKEGAMRHLEREESRRKKFGFAKVYLEVFHIDLNKSHVEQVG